ncbi:sn-glycerol-1-phosphate dehydrogenase [Occultella kanbiaonis]|uniref:sn-glycerol-1-phosphate dehydrogenase n=1 Tax=Occultella kanbiaonis TaxID=2675754 RepID=UPI001F47FAC8|nr:sn-glycerol-1-phosphate dehydrogenase [Occultella kanbiaonis]
MPERATAPASTPATSAPAAARLAAALRDATDTRDLRFGPGAVSRTGAMFAGLFPGRAAVVVADEHTWAVAGAAVTAALAGAGVEVLAPVLLAGRPVVHADYDTVTRLRVALEPLDAVAVAVGSGTLNDVTKRASAELDRPYACVGTAASMDGYTAFGSAITKDGFKQTLAGPAPRGVVADLTVMAGAPALMSGYGFGDLIEKIPAGADWILADELGIEPIDEHVWTLVQGPLREALGPAARIRAGDEAALTGLVEGLLMSGLAMQVHKSSRPASGAGHHFSHLWEMEGLGADDDPPLSHGFKVGLGAVSIAALYERVLEEALTTLDVDECVDRWPSREAMAERVRADFAEPLLSPALAAVLRKYVTAAQLRERLTRLRDRWPVIVERCRAQLLPAADLARLLDDVGAVSRPAQIGLSPQAFRATYRRAQLIRDRYTVLDLLTETGRLGPVVDRLFEPDGHWGRDRTTTGE